MDLRVGEARPVMVEVKSNVHDWTGPEDFPFPWVTVDTTGAYDHKPVKPAAYVLISQPRLGIAVVPGSTRPRWEVHMRPHPRYRQPREVYEVRREELRSIDHMAAALLAREERVAA
jgi:hypothetical protein